MNLSERISTRLGTTVIDIDPMGGGCVGQVYRIRLADGRQAVAKVDEGPRPQLSIEAYMLRYLASHSGLPVPEVWYADDSLLVLAFLPGESRFSRPAQQHAAELLAELHAISAPSFGLERDTLIGGLHQPNPWTGSWLDFFREHRLLYMGGEGLRSKRLPASLFKRLEQFCGRLDRWLEEPEQPSLIHGDVWTTNVLAAGPKITGFVDPAIYFAHPEIELAFTTLFGTFGDAFFDRYQELRPIKAGFFEARRDIYNLYPLLVHVRLFAGSYVNSVDQTLRRFGF